MADDDVSSALERALAEDPGSVTLRLHLAELRLAAGEPARALELAAGAVVVDTANAAARDLVARATAALGGEAERIAEVVPLHGVPGPGAWDVERSAVTLDDVGGLETVKTRLRTSFLGPMRNPALVFWMPPSSLISLMFTTRWGVWRCSFIRLRRSVPPASTSAWPHLGESKPRAS